MKGLIVKCPECAFENRDGAKFCLECGKKLESKCPSCGKNLPPTAKFCDECGHNITDDAEIEVINYARPQSYTPKHLADKILTSRSSIEGERKLVTVLFADIANFTSISEKLDPEEVHQIMDGCFHILMDRIHKYEGSINQFTGDGVMALFGAPVAHEDHAQRSCRAALAIQQAMDNYSDRIEKDTGLEFKMRIGINSGPVIVGAIGDDLRMDYTAVGDTTNLGSRMESNAKPGSILISDKTYGLVKDYFVFSSLSEIEIKGKEQPQNTFELLKQSDVQSRIGASIAKGLTRFVGRKKSMSILLSAFEKVRSKSGQVVGIVGEAGVGKSRLLFEMRNNLSKGDFSYLEGCCLHYGNSISYLPILDIVKVYFDIIEGDREFIAKKKINDKIIQLDKDLENLNSSFQELLSLSVDDERFIQLDPKEKRDKIFEALRDLLVRASQDIPLIIAVEDLHWMDKTSEEFIGYLIGSIVNTPILLLLLYRPEYTHQWGSKSYYSQIGLDQLGNESSGELVKAILEGGDVAPEINALILNRSAGNPLFMEEFTHTLVENGSIEKKGNQFVFTGKETDINVPDTVQGIIAARLDRLEDNLKRTMQIASVIGRDFAFRILQTITGMREELKTYLLNLQGLEFIYEKNLFPELEYIFKHALIQEVTYNSLLSKSRNEIHEKIGNAIEEIYIERLEEFYEVLAYHFSRGNEISKAIEYSKMSGEKAIKNYSHWEAYRYYKNAVELINELPTGNNRKESKLEALISMLPPICTLGYPVECFWALKEAEKLSQELNDSESLAKVSINISGYYAHNGKYDMAIKYSEKSYIESHKINDLDQMVSLAFSLAVAYEPQGMYQKLINIVSEVINLIEKKNKTKALFGGEVMNAYSALCAYCGTSMGFLGDFDDGFATLDKGIKNALEINDLLILGGLEMGYGGLNIARGGWKGAITHLQNSVKYLDEAQYTWMASHVQVRLGYAYSMCGDKKKGESEGKSGIDKHQITGVELWLASSHLYLGLVFLESDNLRDALKYIEKAVSLSENNNEILIKGQAHIALGRILTKMGPEYYKKAQKQFQLGIDIFNKIKVKPDYALGCFFFGELSTVCGEFEKGMQQIKKAENMFKEMKMDYWANQIPKISI